MIENWNIFSAKPGRVVGPVISNENGSIKAACDPKRSIRNDGVPPQGIPPSYCFSMNTEKPERSDITEAERDLSLQSKHQNCTAEKLTPDIATDTNSSLFYPSRAAKAEPAGSQIAVEANLLQARSQFVGITAAAAATAAHRSIGTVQYGLSRMF